MLQALWFGTSHAFQLVVSDGRRDCRLRLSEISGIVRYRAEHRYLSRLMGDGGLDGTLKACFSSVRWLRVTSFWVLGSWIASKPFLRRCSWTGNLGIEANRAFLVDVGIDRLRGSAVGAIENLCRGRNGNSRVLGFEMPAQHLECFRRFGLEHLTHFSW